MVRVGDARRVSMMIEQECCSEGVAFFGGVGRKERGGDSGVRVSVFGAGGRSVVVSSIMQRRQAGRAQAGKQASKQAKARREWMVGGWIEGILWVGGTIACLCATRLARMCRCLLLLCTLCQSLTLGILFDLHYCPSSTFSPISRSSCPLSPTPHSLYHPTPTAREAFAGLPWRWLTSTSTRISAARPRRALCTRAEPQHKPCPPRVARFAPQRSRQSALGHC